MQKILNITLMLSLTLALAACGSGAKDKKGELGDKKAKLEKLKGEQAKLNEEITKLQADIAKLDTSADAGKPKLVALETIGTDSFRHYIDLQGKIDAQNVAMVAPRGQGGVVKAVHVRQGQSVGKGQLILTLDNSVAMQQVEALRSQLPALESQAKLAESVYERQQNLWKNNIGTEVQVLQAQTNAESAAAQLKAAQAQVRLAQESAAMANVHAEISGTIDVVNVKVGEFFSPQSAAMPASGIRIVNTGDLKVVVQVPENYLDKVNAGNLLVVTLPEANNKVINTKISVAGKLIDPVSRTFFIEGKVPQDRSIKPNQIARVQIQDYTNNNAITIPVNTLQSDDKGKYVLVAAEEAGKLRARRRTIIVGELYGDRLEVKSGLQEGDKIITGGFQGLYDGQLITTGI
ncbi:MAG TPA: efflux RND transporter periplasmic adaptor subunit [Chitinophagaceae bacterium]|nr:efflux RND transporter periplasmic adaptor subunit [Chitinophagaceae bacterium]